MGVIDPTAAGGAISGDPAGPTMANRLGGLVALAAEDASAPEALPV